MRAVLQKRRYIQNNMTKTQKEKGIAERAHGT
jgi:hypothetical protein